MCYDKTDSDICSAGYVVAHGSNLSPLLFFIYVNDLAYVSTELFTILFAEDSNLFAPEKMPKMS